MWDCQEFGECFAEHPLEYIIMGIILLAIIYYIFKRIRNALDDNEVIKKYDEKEKNTCNPNDK